MSKKVKEVQTHFGSPGGLIRRCVCAIEDKGAAAGLESSEALGLAGAGPGGRECSPQVVRLGPRPGCWPQLAGRLAQPPASSPTLPRAPA